MKQTIIQSFIIDGEDDFWTLDDQLDDINKYLVSLKFYSFMNSDFDQISHITGIDFSPLDEMAKYIPLWEMDEKIEMMDIELFHIYRKKVEQDNEKLLGNINKVIACLKQLILELEMIIDLSDKLNVIDTINSDYYRNLDNKEIVSYNENNLTQDLRNILLYSLLAKSRGVETTFFTFR